MSPVERKALAARMEREARADRVVRVLRYLDSANQTPAELLARVDDDRCWFAIWTGALGVGAQCPSDATRHAVREAVRARLPPLAEIYRDELEQLERQRQVGMEVWKP